MTNPSQEPPAPTKDTNKDLKDIDILCTFKFKIEGQNLEHGCNKDQWLYENKGQDAKPQSGTSNILQSPKSGLKGHGYSLHPYIKIERKNMEPECTRDQWSYPNQDQDTSPESGTSSVLQSQDADLMTGILFVPSKSK